MLPTVVASNPDDQDAHYLLFGLYKELGQAAAAGKELQIFQELKRKAADQQQKSACVSIPLIKRPQPPLPVVEATSALTNSALRRYCL